jgi:hypothetical protein
MPPDRGSRPASASGAPELAIAVAALMVVVYLALLMDGFFFKLLFLAAAAGLGVVTWRAWRSRS